MPKWAVIYAVERAVELDADNINAIAEIAKREKRLGECIVSIRLQR